MPFSYSVGQNLTEQLCLQNGTKVTIGGRLPLINNFRVHANGGTFVLMWILKSTKQSFIFIFMFFHHFPKESLKAWIV